MLSKERCVLLINLKLHDSAGAKEQALHNENMDFCGCRLRAQIFEKPRTLEIALISTKFYFWIIRKFSRFLLKVVSYLRIAPHVVRLSASSWSRFFYSKMEEAVVDTSASSPPAVQQVNPFFGREVNF